MPDVTFTYPRPIPDLTIETTGGGQLGNCYSATTYRVTSLQRLSVEKLKALNAAGVLGFGQEFYIRSQADGKEPAAREVESACVAVDKRTGKPTGDPAINPYSGEPYGSSKYSVYVYDCESRCDSGD
jgi:hypothetical protein